MKKKPKVNIKTGDTFEIVLTETTGERITYIIYDEEAAEILEELIDSDMVSEAFDETAELTKRQIADERWENKESKKEPGIPYKIVMKELRKNKGDKKEDKRREKELRELRKLLAKIKERRSQSHDKRWEKMKAKVKS